MGIASSRGTFEPAPTGLSAGCSVLAGWMLLLLGGSFLGPDYRTLGPNRPSS